MEVSGRKRENCNQNKAKRENSQHRTGEQETEKQLLEIFLEIFYTRTWTKIRIESQILKHINEYTQITILNTSHYTIIYGIKLELMKIVKNSVYILDFET